MVQGRWGCSQHGDRIETCALRICLLPFVLDYHKQSDSQTYSPHIEKNQNVGNPDKHVWAGLLNFEDLEMVGRRDSARQGFE
jgi:hypothetical protein